MKRLLPTYRPIASALSLIQSPMLLTVRLYWGFQFAADTYIAKRLKVAEPE